MRQSRTGSFEPDLNATSDIVSVPFDYGRPAVELNAPHIPAWETGQHLKHEEFSRAVSLGLFDYLRKSRSQGFVVSLSGGADSSAISCLVWLLVKFALRDLDVDGLRHKLRHIATLATSDSAEDFVGKLLSCVYQATENSSMTTRNAARSVASAIGAEFLEFDIDALVKRYIEIVSQSIGRPLSWQQDDLALQNIQARVRSPSVWLLANIRGALLVSTSNRSEAAVGYATMDGDTSGGLSPIAGIDKAYLRQWLRWLEAIGPSDAAPIPALAAVNIQAPTAELRPSSSKQTDEDDLMPYELLDAVERAAIRDKLMPLDVFQRIQAEFPHYTAPQLHLWVERFFRLWCRNQWKRERYAPCFHLDDENLDPKTWCRFPILSGGFERELAELRTFVQQLST